MRRLSLFVLLLLTSAPMLAQDWKTEAQKRIEKFRKAPVLLSAQDSLGNPLADVKVSIYMLQHEFIFGSNYKVDVVEDLVNNGYPIGSDHPYYNHLRHFNSLTPGNAGKWPWWVQDDRRHYYRQMRAWIDSLGIANRGHGAIWESGPEGWNSVPEFILNEEDNSVINDSIRSHITDYVNSLKEEIYQLDLVNEPVHETYIAEERFGRQSLKEQAELRAEWHKLAKSLAPDLSLVINEFDLIQSGNDFHQSFVEYVQHFLAAGGPADEIGMQGHFQETIPTADELMRRLDEVRKTGLPMHITEFDMVSNAYEDMERLLTICFADSMMTGFTMWGSWDAVHWLGNAPIYDEDWTIKPSGQAWFDLVKGKWWTDTTFTLSQSDDMVSAFKGSHIVTIEYNGKMITDTISLGDDTLRLTYLESQFDNQTPEITAVGSLPDTICKNNPIVWPVEASDPDGTIKAVRYFIDHDLVKTATSDSSALEWTFTLPGVYRFHAEITDDKGGVIKTEEIKATVINSALYENYVVDNPPAGELMLSNDPFLLKITFDENQENVNKQEIWVDTVLYKEFESAQSTIPLENGLSAGDRTIQVKIWDDSGCPEHTLLDLRIFSTDRNSHFALDSTKRTEHDVEERSDGSIDFDGDLDLGQNVSGIRFEDINLPAEAIIDSAFIQFASEKENQTGEGRWLIYGEASSVSSPFEEENLSDRSKTEASVLWTTSDWLIYGEAGPEQKSPDVSPILQEMVALPAWKLESPAVFIIDFEEELPKKSAIAFDQVEDLSPKLQVYYHFDFTEFEQPEPPINLQWNGNLLTWEKSPSPEVTDYIIYVNDAPYDSITSFLTGLNYNQDLTGNTQFSVAAKNRFGKKSDKASLSLITAAPQSAEKDFIVYPMPVTGGSLQIEFVGQAELRLVNSAGFVTKNLFATERAYLNVADLPQGLYLLVKITETSSEALKVIIE